MNKTLIIAEKPSVARDIARVLGANGRGDGFLSGGEWIVSWALGHLVTLKEPDEIDIKYKKWSMAELPMLPEKIGLKVIEKTRPQYAILKKLMNDPEVVQIICATDSGREGELIFRLIYEQARAKKPVKRLWISSMTDAAIRDGFAKLRPSSEYDALYLSARARAEADWLVGMNASRAFTLRYNALLSVGRVQTPTLKFLVDRDREIEQFKPRDYFEVRAEFQGYEGLYLDPKTEETRVYQKELALKIQAETRGGQGRVERVKREKKRTPPEKLYDLTALQRDANRKYKLSAQQTLTIAQALYERHKLLTYPRTDSRYLSRDMIDKVKKTLDTFSEPYAQWAQAVAANPPVPNRIYDDKKVTDHHAIIPTERDRAKVRLTPEEANVYDLVARRFIAAHYPDYEYGTTEILTRVGEHLYKTTGVTPLKEGWRALYRDEPDGESAKLPEVKEGEVRPVTDVKLKADKTKPPKPLTDATLLSLMERAGRTVEDEELREQMRESGLGTPATRASIIERLIQVGYAQRQAQAVLSTEKGRRLIAVAPEEISSAETTGRWEKALNEMARERDRAALQQKQERFMVGIRRFSGFLVEYAKVNAPQAEFEREERTVRTRDGKRRVVQAAPVDAVCPVCGQGRVTENAKAFGCSRYRDGCRFTIWKDTLKRTGGPMITKAAVEKLLKGQPVRRKEGIIEYQNGRIVFKKTTPT